MTAVRVAKIPRDDFTGAVESDDPPTVTALAEQGKDPRRVFLGHRIGAKPSFRQPGGVTSAKAKVYHHINAATETPTARSATPTLTIDTVRTVRAWRRWWGGCSCR